LKKATFTVSLPISNEPNELGSLPLQISSKVAGSQSNQAVENLGLGIFFTIDR
jgi:hypothetical protein